MKMQRFGSVIIGVLIIGWMSSVVLAQQGPIKNLRYDDDFKYLLNDTIVKKGWEKLKYRPLFKDTNSHWSLGGEVREWYEVRTNSNFGDLPPGFIENNKGSLHHRIMLHADFKLNQRWRVFAQLNNTLEFGNPNPPIPEIIVDGLGVHQLFVETSLGNKGPESFLNIRLGRQELSFGNELLISSREGPNNRLAFDGISLIKGNIKHQTQFFVATPVVIQPKVFDNTHTEEFIWGAYSNLRKNKSNRMDVYYVGMYSERRKYNYIAGKQTRHTVGTRLYNHLGKVFYDAEWMYQTGKYNAELIHAFNFTGEVRYAFKKKTWKPMVGLGLSYITGDRDGSDKQLNTFDPYYPKPVYGLGIAQGPSNISHIRPIVGFEPLAKLFVNFSWYYLLRPSVKDGTYTPDMTQVRPMPGVENDKHGVGTQYALDVFYFWNKNLTLISFVSYVTPGAYVRETGAGLNSFFGAAMVQYKF